MQGIHCTAINADQYLDELGDVSPPVAQQHFHDQVAEVLPVLRGHQAVCRERRMSRVSG